ncbi:MAG: MBL fold metallo-hydrolase [Thermodesulfobacteriota bacterium]
MKKSPHIALYLFLLLAASQAAFAAPSPVTHKLADKVYAFIGGNGTTNSGFVITDKGVVLIDAQGPQSRAEALKTSTRKNTEKPVIYTINTHYHGDHTFGNQFFKGSRIISHKETRSLLISEDAAHRKRFKKFFGPQSLTGFRLTLPEITFTHELRLLSGNMVIIVRYPGTAHTRGDAYVYLPALRIVFAGDILYKGRLPWLGEGSVKGTIKALEELIALDAEIYVPGHGGIATKQDVIAFRQYLLDLTEEVMRLKARGKTIKEVSAGIKLPAYSGYLKYREWLPLNAAAVYRELEQAEAEAKKAAVE